MPVLQLAAQSVDIGTLEAALGLGFLLGVLGHVVRSRTLIVTAIIVIGGISAYIFFVVQPS